MDVIVQLIRRYAKTAWKHRWKAIAVAWLVCLGGWAVVYTLPNQFEASARLYVDADSVLTPLLKGIAADTEPASQIEILQRTLLSRPNLSTLIDKTDLDLTLKSYSDRERLISNLQTAIKVHPETKNLFSIVYRDTDPKRAAEVVQTLLTIFIERASGSNRSDMDNARRFLDHQIASYEQQLRAAEKRRADFKTQFLDLLPDGQTGATKLDEADAAIRGLQGKVTDAAAKDEQLKKELAQTSPLIATEQGGAGGGGGGGSRLRQLQQQLTELRLRDTDDHPDVIALRKEIEAERASPTPSAAGPAAAPAAGGRSVPNPVYEQIKTRLIDVEADLASLQRQLAEAKQDKDAMVTKLKSQPGVQAEYEAMDRDYSVLKKNYEELLGRREEANIAQAADTQADKVKLQVIDPPETPRNPVAPNRVLLVSVVMLAGLAAGAAYAFIMAQLDSSFRTVEDLRGLGLTVLGGISSLAQPTARRNMSQIVGFAAALVLLAALYGGIVSRIARVMTSA